MMGVEVFESAFNELRARFAGLTKDVYLVPREQMKEETDLLRLCGVEYDEKLYFNDQAADLATYRTSDAGGVTINFYGAAVVVARSSLTRAACLRVPVRISFGSGGTTRYITS